jgi:hypothetical protein
VVTGRLTGNQLTTERIHVRLALIEAVVFRASLTKPDFISTTGKMSDYSRLIGSLDNVSKKLS